MLPLLLYTATLAPTVTLEDSGEFITAAYHLGVPHPSGYPLWCLLTHPFTWLPWGSVAERVHLASAACGAATAWLVYLVAARLFADWRAALVAALGLAASQTLWSQAVIAEVYALNAALTVLLLYLALRWRESGSPGWLYLLSLVTGLGLGNHLLLALAALPVGVWLVAIDPRAVLRWRVLAACATLLALGLCVYLYLPIRAAADPPINVGDPRTLAGLVAHVRRDVYFAPTEAGRTAGSLADVLRHTLDAGREAVVAFGWPLAALAVLGVALWPRSRRDVLGAVLAIAVCNTALLNLLLTAPHVPLWVYVHRVYYIPAHVAVALCIGSAAAALLHAEERRRSSYRRLVLAALAIAVVVAAWRSYPEASQRDNHIARNLALDLLDSAPPNAGFLPLGDEVLYPLLYARFVEGLRPDVKLLSRWYGWRGEPYSILLSGDPLGDQMRKDLAGLQDLVSMPYGLVYALVPRSGATSADAADFVPLPHPPRDLGLEDARPDVFNDAVRARYAAYHARLGALLAKRGEARRAEAELDRAELLDPGDPFVEVLLARVYGELGIREERRAALLAAALRNHQRSFDPHTSRYEAVSREDIERELAGIRASKGTAQ